METVGYVETSEHLSAADAATIYKRIIGDIVVFLSRFLTILTMLPDYI
jgi:hypothetical protein